MLTDKLEYKDDETPETQKMFPPLPDTEETANLLDDTVVKGNTEKLATLILRQNANINSQHIYKRGTSLLASAIMNKHPTIVVSLLKMRYLTTRIDVDEIRDLIGELKTIKESSELDEKNRPDLKAGLAVLRAIKEEIKDHHFKIISDEFKFSDIKAEIDAAIIALSDKLESKDDESPGTQKVFPPLPDTQETANLLDDTVVRGNTEKLATLVLLQNANINSQHIYNRGTSLLASAIMNKHPAIVISLLEMSYLATRIDVDEIRDLIGELKIMKESSEFDEKNKPDLKPRLAVLRVLKEEIKDRHFKMISDKIKFCDIKSEIDAAIIALSQPSAIDSTTNNTVSTTAATTVLHAFQDVNASAISIDMLFSLIGEQKVDRFSALLTWLISQNAMFNINPTDKDGKTFLHHASINADNRFLKVLLENKANPNIGDKHGWTPVHWSAFTGKNFDLFMESATFSPIDWKAKTKRNETIFQLAVKGKKIPEADLAAIFLKCSHTATLD